MNRAPDRARRPAFARPVVIRTQRRRALAPWRDPLERGDALSAAATRACGWKPCGRDFQPPRMIAAFCSDACRLSAQRWRNSRGAALVAPLLAITHARANRRDAAAQADASGAWRWILQRGRDLSAELDAAGAPAIEGGDT
jgi:hypothetical protein